MLNTREVNLSLTPCELCTCREWGLGHLIYVTSQMSNTYVDTIVLHNLSSNPISNNDCKDMEVVMEYKVYIE